MAANETKKRDVYSIVEICVLLPKINELRDYDF